MLIVVILGYYEHYILRAMTLEEIETWGSHGNEYVRVDCCLVRDKKLCHDSKNKVNEKSQY